MALLEEKKYDSGEAFLNYAEGLDSGPPLVCFTGSRTAGSTFSP